MDLMCDIFLEEYRPAWMPRARPGQEESARVMMRQLASTSGEPTPAPLAALHSGLLQHGTNQRRAGAAASQSQLTCSSRTCRWCRARSCGSRTPRSPPSWWSSPAQSPCPLHNIVIVRRGRQCLESIIFIKFKLQMPEACHEVC